MEKEIWKDVAGYEGYYQVSNMGRVRSLKRIILRSNKEKMTIKSRMLKLRKNNHGYLAVILYKYGKIKSYYVHTLVLENFIGVKPNGCECCHFPDRNKTNNNLNNLRWDTLTNNAKDKSVHGTVPRGEKCNLSKLKEEQVKKIKILLKNGEMSQSEIAKLFNVGQSAIWYIAKRINWAWLT